MTLNWIVVQGSGFDCLGKDSDKNQNLCALFWNRPIVYATAIEAP